ncbi:malignant fibrous histiocytoma-amplified sequence 1 homolog [Clytia hemisphaerica]|uniref:Roc domain-containing protein n=1 Tax=Clytia hemisphaerica TaxID=252671 RepID=A0A7M5X3V1_9CNID
MSVSGIKSKRQSEKSSRKLNQKSKKLSRSWPNNIQKIFEDNHGPMVHNATISRQPNFSSISSLAELQIEDSKHSHSARSHLSKLFGLFDWPWFATSKEETKMENSSEDYPIHIPYKRFLNTSRVKLFSNNLEFDDKIDKLSHVNVLSLSKNQFSSGDGIVYLPPSFSRLESIKELDLRGNPLKTFPEVILNLQELCTLNMADCQLEDVPRNITRLTKLKKLLLENNQIKLQNVVLDFPNLEQLYLTNNKISDISGIQMKSLLNLDVCENFIDQIPDVLTEKCCSLKQLVMKGNSITKIPKSIKNLKALKWLDLSQNLLTKIPKDIGEVSTLQYLNLSWNDLTALPESITKLNKLKKFYCGENPLQRPPYEIAKEGPDSIRSYFRALDGSAALTSKRLKLMILGNEKSGKTTLAKAIYSYEEPEPVEERTIGMDFFEWKDKNGLNVLIVDCAGQKKYILTHQIFMQTGILFAVVLNLKDYNMTEEAYNTMIGEWIELILTSVPNAVILIVPTFIDQCGSLEEIKQKCQHILTLVDKRRRKRQEIRIRYETRSKGSFERAHKLKRDDIPTLPASFLFRNSVEEETKIHHLHKEPRGGEVSSTEAVTFTPSADNKSKVYLIPVSNRKHLHGLTLLREEIYRISNDETLCPNINREIPESWWKFEQLCNHEKDFKETLEVDELWKTVQEKKISFHTKKDMIEALKYFDSTSPILFLPCVKDVVFLNINWLFGAFKTIFRHDFNEFFVYKEEYEDMNPIEFCQEKRILMDQGKMGKKLFKYALWDVFKESEDNFNKVLALLMKFGLIYNINEEEFLIPWYLPESIPSAIDSKSNNDQVYLTCLVSTIVRLPEGFFQRFIVKVHSLNIFFHIRPWSNGFIGTYQFDDKNADPNHKKSPGVGKRDFKLKLFHEKLKGFSQITVEGYANKQDIYHVWNMLNPVLEALEDFLQEWKGIKYTIFTACPSCLQSTPSKQPFFWDLKLKHVYDDFEPIYCQLEGKRIDKWLVYPPPSFSILDHLDDEKRNERLKANLSPEEKDNIAGKMGDRAEDLRAALGVEKGLMEKISSDTNLRERVYQIIQFWEQKNKIITIERFMKCLNGMTPLPHEIFEILLHVPEDECCSP